MKRILRDLREGNEMLNIAAVTAAVRAAGLDGSRKLLPGFS